MKKICLIYLLFSTGLLHITAAAGRFHFTPVYNYETKNLVTHLKAARTDQEKLNLLISLAFDNNYLVESPAYIDTSYLNQLIKLNEHAKLFDDKPFRTLRLALREGMKNNYAAELSLLKTSIDQFDEQNTEIVMPLIEARWIFNLADQQEDKYRFYTQKLSYYLQTGQYNNAAACYHCLGGYYYVFKGDLNSSINNHLKAGELFKTFSNIWYQHEFIVVGSRYVDWGNLAKSRFYLQTALKLETKFGIGNDRFGAIETSAEAQYDLKHYQASLNYLNQLSAEDFNQASSSIRTLKALNYVGLGHLNDAFNEMNQIKEAPAGAGLTRVINIGGYDPDYAFYKYYEAIKDSSIAGRYLHNAYQKAKADANVRSEITYLKELGHFYGQQGNTGKAWQYTVLYNRLNDSLQARTNGFNVASYENEQKENQQNKKLIMLRQQRAVQEAVISQRNIIIWISLIGLIAVLASLLLIYRQLQINKRNIKNLKITQAQLIQSEKMASLGELTAGIAHEIQNPLNFVNNFSELNAELVAELKQELEKGDLEEIKAIATDIDENSQKINMHGRRAEAIVKGMLQHSQSGSGKKEPTNINTLADEYLRLSYHGMRAKDKSFNSELITHLDTDLPKIPVVPQDIGRVLLNSFNNAFYAVNQKQKTASNEYKPEISVSTSSENGQVVIKVKDNGIGIPAAIKEKIMQPFFTTKPTGEGTGLGLSLSYDIVVKGHNGRIEVNSEEGVGSEFIIQLPHH